jgi:predicted transcriptional regulator of viral defense system
MKSTDAFSELIRLQRPIIETREVAARLGLPADRVGYYLRSWENAGLVLHLHRGLWALHSNVDPFSVPPYLTAPFPAYVSFWSALAQHGMIEQVPRQIFVASLAQTRRVTTAVGTYSIHQLVPELFDGYSLLEGGAHIASSEKALFDTVYLRAARGGLIFLPELELPAGFQMDRLEEWTGRITRPRLRTLVSRGLERALTAATQEPSSSS